MEKIVWNFLSSFQRNELIESYRNPNHWIPNQTQKALEKLELVVRTDKYPYWSLSDEAKALVEWAFENNAVHEWFYLIFGAKPKSFIKTRDVNFYKDALTKGWKPVNKAYWEHLQENEQ